MASVCPEDRSYGPRADRSQKKNVPRADSHTKNCPEGTVLLPTDEIKRPETWLLGTKTILLIEVSKSDFLVCPVRFVIMLPISLCEKQLLLTVLSRNTVLGDLR